MTDQPHIPYIPPERYRAKSDRLFALCLLLGLAVTATAIIVVSRHLNERVDLTRLVVVDVQRARVEMGRRVATGAAKTAPKSRPEPVKAAPKVRAAPAPVVHVKAPPVTVKPPPAIQVKPLPAARPSPSPAPAPSPAAARPAPISPGAASRPVATTPTPAHKNPGSRVSTGATSTMGTTIVGGEGHTQAGASGAGIGDADGQGTGAGRGIGAATPNPNRTGDATGPPPDAPASTSGAPAAPTRTPATKSPPAPVSETTAQTQTSKDERPPNRIADRAEAKIIGRLPQPEMPAFLADEGGGGRVTVEFTVRADGSIANVRIKKSDDSRLNAAATAAARRIRALPAIQDGVPRDVLATATFTFRAD